MEKYSNISTTSLKISMEKESGLWDWSKKKYDEITNWIRNKTDSGSNTTLDKKQALYDIKKYTKEFEDKYKPFMKENDFKELKQRLNNVYGSLEQEIKEEGAIPKEGIKRYELNNKIRNIIAPELKKNLKEVDAWASTKLFTSEAAKDLYKLFKVLFIITLIIGTFGLAAPVLLFAAMVDKA